MSTMRIRICAIVFGAAAVPLLWSATLAAEGNAAKGERVFRACEACHSLEPDHSMTGPSLAGLWNRKAGTLPSFPRYSAALKSSGVVWNDNTLDEWLAGPQAFIPGKP